MFIKRKTDQKTSLKNRYKIDLFRIIKAAWPALIILSCATNTGAFLSVDSAVYSSDYTAAIDIIINAQSGNKTLYGENNAISLFLDKGLLEYYAGNYSVSSADLQNAERLIEEAYTKSITQGFLSFIINDNTKDYPGEDFEDIYLNVFNALNYYNRGNFEGALVEIRKLSNSSGKLDMLARKYEYIDPNTGAGLNDTVYKETGIGDLPKTLSVNFSNSALARYLGALFYQAEGNTDSARIEFEQLQRAFSSNKSIYYNPVPAAVEQARNVPPDTARLNVISFTGLSPVKEEQNIVHYLPFQHPVLQIAFLKLPVLAKRASLITRIEVMVEGKGSFNLELLEDMGAVVEETFKARYSSIVLKTYIRTLIKYIVADITALETVKQQGELAGFLVAVAARTAMDISESADVRMSRYLPDKAHIGGINLDPGIYNVIINYYQGRNLIYQDAHRNVAVNRGEMNLLQSINLK
ncbi:MAG: hypothetical protein LBG94_08930 [Treponema sp.]|jgi:hypothetical protein|nr:hypothetical protein [Treponema sp.]